MIKCNQKILRGYAMSNEQIAILNTILAKISELSPKDETKEVKEQWTQFLKFTEK